ncbi:hypothetical protein [Microcoleus sp. S11D4]
MRRGFQPPADCATKQTNFRSVSGRSGFLWMGDRTFGLMGDRTALLNLWL